MYICYVMIYATDLPMRAPISSMYAMLRKSPKALNIAWRPVRSHSGVTRPRNFDHNRNEYNWLVVETNPSEKYESQLG